ncbi:MAG: hypothetical protein COA41_14415 [Sphingopyxis sp.]|nr:MAG: hypothetical protein COA41_14415 [Sphingopyxis sp.]
MECAAKRYLEARLAAQSFWQNKNYDLSHNPTDSGFKLENQLFLARFRECHPDRNLHQVERLFIKSPAISRFDTTELEMDAAKFRIKRDRCGGF